MQNPIDVPVRVVGFRVVDGRRRPESPSPSHPSPLAALFGGGVRTSRARLAALLRSNGIPVDDFGDGSEDGPSGTLREVLGRCASTVRDLREMEHVYEGASINMEGVYDEETGERLRDAVELTVTLEEKKWYNLYVGGGLKSPMTGFGPGLPSSGPAGDPSSPVPTPQFETTGSLVNLLGRGDVFSAAYVVDVRGDVSAHLRHVSPRPPASAPLPLFPLFRFSSLAASADVHDHRALRSYVEHRRELRAALSTHPDPAAAVRAARPSVELAWSLGLRDVKPVRHPSLPHASRAGPAVLLHAGPDVRHALSADLRGNGAYLDDPYAPTEGVDGSLRLEAAGPPGDRAGVRLEAGGSLHRPLGAAALHLTLHTGLARPLPGLLPQSTGRSGATHLSDRFHVGGPLQLRGFEAGGIGPRSSRASGEGADAVGGDVYYVAGLAASAPFPHPFVADRGGRVMGFLNVGTCSGWGVPARAVMMGSRASCGVGAYLGTAVGRAEVTYAVPLRQGPLDVTKRGQIGFGLNFT